MVGPPNRLRRLRHRCAVSVRRGFPWTRASTELGTHPRPHRRRHQEHLITISPNKPRAHTLDDPEPTGRITRQPRRGAARSAPALPRAGLRCRTRRAFGTCQVGPLGAPFRASSPSSPDGLGRPSLHTLREAPRARPAASSVQQCLAKLVKADIAGVQRDGDQDPFLIIAAAGSS